MDYEYFTFMHDALYDYIELSNSSVFWQGLNIADCDYRTTTEITSKKVKLMILKLHACLL